LTARGGFTLIEVLVVMAIMVILFGMLFVPISSSIDMAREGQARTQMQQHLQMAMQRINRGLATARYIYLPEYIPLAGADSTPLTADDEYLINYSNVTFQPEGYGGTAAVRYAVMTRDYLIEEIPAGSGFWYCVPEPPDTDNPWILYRMEGRMAPVGARNLFGADYDEDGDGTYDYFVIGLWSSRNALTPARGADIPVTRTICLDANGYLLAPLAGGTDWAEGYVARGDLDDNGTDDIDEVFGGAGVMLIYIHDGVKFGPLRVENERLADAGSGGSTSFSAEYGHWLGLPNPVVNGTYSIGDAIWNPSGTWPTFPALINSSELRPRIVVRRETTDPDNPWVMDTDALHPATGQPPVSIQDGAVIDNMYGISWNSSQGTVTLASAAGPAFIGFDSDAGTPLPDMPGTAPDPHYPWVFGGYDASVPPATIASSNPAYVEPIVKHDTLSAAVLAGETRIRVTDAAQFDVGDQVRITEVPALTPTETKTVNNVRTSINELTLNAVLTNGYSVGAWVQVAQRSDGQTPTYHTAYSTYGIAPPMVAGQYDKMVVPDSVRVWVNAAGASGSASKEYRRVTSERKNIGPGQFTIEAVAPGDYRAITIHFGNGELGDDMRRTPPPSPDDASTYGAPESWDDTPTALTDFWIEISYDVRRNFSTATLHNDQVDVSYSTRAVYNVSLELLPWRYYQDNDTDHIWTPYQHIKGVDLQAHIPIAALGG